MKIIKVKDGMRALGTVRLYDADTGELLKTVANMVVADGRNLNANLLINASGYTTGISYCALGTGTTAVSDSQHTLVTETVRAQATQKTVSTDTITVSTFFVYTACGIHIKETALFGHTTATGTANSGVMFSRALLDYDNSSSPRNLMIAWSVQLSHA
jgi:hypothetical protein